MKNRTQGFNKHGVTLVEVMVGTAVFGIIAVLFLTMFGRCGSNITGESHDKAVSEARTWSTEMGIKVKGVSCANMDTNHDGYISCSVSSELPGGGVDIMPIECATSWSINSGCRAARIMPVRGRL